MQDLHVKFIRIRMSETKLLHIRVLRDNITMRE